LAISTDQKFQKLTASQAKRLPVGQRVRWLRKRKGLSHDALAARAKTSRSYLIRIEKGIHKPSAEMRARIAVALDSSQDFLMDGDEDEEEAALVRDLMVVMRRVVAHERIKETA
jgi:transcriptional regulator with XRE-family HTH domain